MKHTVPQIVSDLDKAKFSAYPSELIQMFVDHEDIIINSNEVRYFNLNPSKSSHYPLPPPLITRC